jgi:hypothetical protein
MAERERVTVGDRERLTEVVGDRVNGAEVGFTLRLTVWVGVIVYQVLVGVIVVLVERVNVGFTL